jgi:hypothetical protein
MGWFEEMQARAADEKARKAQRADARLRKRQGPMLLRICRHCGHEWVVPKRLRDAARQGSLGAALTGRWTTGALFAGNAKQLDTCPACGSVRHFREERIKD